MSPTAITAFLSIKAANAEERRPSDTGGQIDTSPINALNRREDFFPNPPSPKGFPRETLKAMDDAVAGHVSGPYKSNSGMWTEIFDEEEAYAAWNKAVQGEHFDKVDPM